MTSTKLHVPFIILYTWKFYNIKFFFKILSAFSQRNFVYYSSLQYTLLYSTLCPHTPV